jgi:hypothetical protein
MAVENAGGHKHNPNGILSLLVMEHFPGIVQYDEQPSLAYSFENYVIGPNAVDRDSREFNNKVEGVKQELWVSPPHIILFNMSHSLHILEIMYGCIVFVCRISTNVSLDMRPRRMWWLPRAVRSSSRHTSSQS